MSNDRLIEFVDIVEGDTAEQAIVANTENLDIGDCKTAEIRPLLVDDIKRYLLKNETFYTLHEGVSS